MSQLWVSSGEVEDVIKANVYTSGKSNWVDGCVICRYGLDWKMKSEMPVRGTGGSVMQVVAYVDLEPKR